MRGKLTHVFFGDKNSVRSVNEPGQVLKVDVTVQRMTLQCHDKRNCTVIRFCLGILSRSPFEGAVLYALNAVRVATHAVNLHVLSRNEACSLDRGRYAQ